MLADDARVIVRPSGPEPKIKCYLEVVIPAEMDIDSVPHRSSRDLKRDPRHAKPTCSGG